MSLQYVYIPNAICIGIILIPFQQLLRGQVDLLEPIRKSVTYAKIEVISYSSLKSVTGIIVVYHTYRDC